MATNAQGTNNNCRLLYVYYYNSGQHYLCDSGAKFSVYPATQSDKVLGISGDRLIAANGTSINTYGQRAIPINLGLGRKCTWSFILADVTKPILGADFFFHNNIMTDVRNQRLVDATTYANIPAKGSISTKIPDSVPLRGKSTNFQTSYTSKA